MEDRTLSTDARRLLDYLRDNASSPGEARTDARIASDLCLSPRAVIDLADELLAHGHGVIARVSDPMGRWLLKDGAPGEHIAEAVVYARSLENRAKSIFARRQHLQHAIAMAQTRRPVEVGGQLRLFRELPVLEAPPRR